MFMLIPRWWTIGSLSEFNTWYPAFGSLVWVFKNLALLALSFIFLYFFFLFRKKPNNAVFDIFITFVILSWIIGEQHPFSRIPMYHSFPNYAYVFSLSDKNDRLIPLQNVSPLGAAELSHLYYTSLYNHEILYGYAREDSFNLEIIGADMINNTPWINPNFLADSCFYLNRQYFFVSDKGFKVINKVIYDSCN
jgi:hypothetical protein